MLYINRTSERFMLVKSPLAVDGDLLSGHTSSFGVPAR